MRRRRYFFCDLCKNQRMVRLGKDADGQRWFYECPKCNSRLTFLVAINGISKGWPKDVPEDLADS